MWTSFLAPAWPGSIAEEPQGSRATSRHALGGQMGGWGPFLVAMDAWVWEDALPLLSGVSLGAARKCHHVLSCLSESLAGASPSSGGCYR